MTFNYSYEDILEQMLSNVPDDVLKIEGSIIYDALGPCAMTLAQLYADLNFTLNQATVETASAPYLDMLCNQMGVWRKEATFAVRGAIFYDSAGELMDVPLLSTFMADGVTFQVTEKISDGYFKLQCTELGSTGNNPIGSMQALTAIPELYRSQLTDVLTEGQDEETDVSLRTRYLLQMREQTNAGNCAQYEEWALDYPGIGKAAVTPCWDGVNTVKVTILSDEGEPASQALVNEFQEYLDPDSEGLGNGVAPIGAVVTVASGTSKTINVIVTITAQRGYDTDVIEDNVEAALKALFVENALVKNKVFYMEVGAAILNATGVDSVSNLKINNSTADISLSDSEVADLGTLTITVN